MGSFFVEIGGRRREIGLSHSLSGGCIRKASLLARVITQYRIPRSRECRNLGRTAPPRVGGSMVGKNFHAFPRGGGFRDDSARAARSPAEKKQPERKIKGRGTKWSASRQEFPVRGTRILGVLSTRAPLQPRQFVDGATKVEWCTDVVAFLRKFHFSCFLLHEIYGCLQMCRQRGLHFH